VIPCFPIWEDVGRLCRYRPFGRGNGTVRIEDHRTDETTRDDVFLVRMIASGTVRTRQRFWVPAWHLELLEEEA